MREMDLYGSIVKHVFHPLWVFRNKSSLLKYLKELEETQYYSTEKIKNLQWMRLMTLLKHAYENCPFYRKRFLKVGLNPSQICSPDDLLKLPPLTKSDVQENLLEMIAENYTKNELVRDTTGGSTGDPLVFYYSKDRRDSRNAAQIRHDRWSFWDIGDRAAYIWGAGGDIHSAKSLKDKFRNILLRRNSPFLNTYAMNENDMYFFAKKIKKFKPKAILGYAQSTTVFAKFLQEHKIFDIHPSAIVSSAEMLLPEDRKLIENVFHCKIFDRYGCREVGIIANECEAHEGLHVNAENLYVEFIREGKPVVGKSSEILITDLRNYAMPFIRYKIGDVSRLLKKPCPCGRGLPLMDTIEGRVTDFITTPEGKLSSGVALTLYLITNIAGIKQAQLIQEEINQLKVRLVKGKEFTKDSAKKLFDNIVKLVGNKVKIEIQYVNEIPKGPSGKCRFVISKVLSNSLYETK